MSYFYSCHDYINITYLVGFGLFFSNRCPKGKGTPLGKILLAGEEKFPDTFFNVPFTISDLQSNSSESLYAARRIQEKLTTVAR